MHGDSGPPPKVPELESAGSDIENDFTIGHETEPLVIGGPWQQLPCDEILPFDHHDFLTAPLASVKRKLEETETEYNWTPPKKKQSTAFGYRLSTPLSYPPAEKKAKIEHKRNVKINFSVTLTPLSEHSTPPAPSGSASPLRIPSISRLAPQDHAHNNGELTIAIRICPFSTLRQALTELEDAGGIELETDNGNEFSINISVSLVFGLQIFVTLNEDDLDLTLVDAVKKHSWHEGHIRDIIVLQPAYTIKFPTDEQEIITEMGSWIQWAPPKQLLDYAIRNNAIGAVRAFFAQHGCSFNFEHEMPKLLGDVLVKRRRDLFRAIFDGLLDSGCDIFVHWDPPEMMDHAWEEFLNIVGWEASSEFRWLISLGVLHANSVPSGRRDLVELVRARRTGVLIALGYPKQAANIITEY